jgi:CheY-like chemotaxis protein
VQNVVFAENGEQVLKCLEKFGSSEFDVVLMDIQMPVNGWV